MVLYKDRAIYGAIYKWCYIKIVIHYIIAYFGHIGKILADYIFHGWSNRLAEWSGHSPCYKEDHGSSLFYDDYCLWNLGKSSTRNVVQRHRLILSLDRCNLSCWRLIDPEIMSLGASSPIPLNFDLADKQCQWRSCTLSGHAWQKCSFYRQHLTCIIDGAREVESKEEISWRLMQCLLFKSHSISFPAMHAPLPLPSLSALFLRNYRWAPGAH